MASKTYTVYLVEDDTAVRDSIALFLGLRGYALAPFADAESFLSALKPDWEGCLLLDIRMPGMSGLDLQKYLRDAGLSMPVIIMTGHGDVESARQAFLANAVDFLEKPVDQGRLTAAIDEAFNRQARAANRDTRERELQKRMDTLTDREKQVMTMAVAGRHNREIAQDLEISARTVEVHKSHIMTKLNVRSIAELVRLVMRHSMESD